MLSMIRAQLYRIAKSRFLVAYAAIVCLFALATPFALWLYGVWPEFAAMGVVQLPDEPLPALRLYGISFVAGSFLSIGISVTMGYYAANDFKSGFVKNLVQTRGGRSSYAVATMACAVTLSVVTTAIAMLLVGLALSLQGYPAVAPEEGEAIRWFVQVVLCVSAYASIAALIGMATGSETAAVLGGVFIGGGAVESISQAILANIPGLPVAIRDCLDGYLAADLNMLTQGIVCDPTSYAQAALTLLAATALAVFAMRRKNIG